MRKDTIRKRPSRRAAVSQAGQLAGYLEGWRDDTWSFVYLDDYQGAPVSLTMPIQVEPYRFTGFPPVFEGLLPEGPQLESLLRLHKIDRGDLFRQLVTVGADMVGSLIVNEVTESPGRESGIG